MQDIVIIGASGLGKEVAYYIRSVNRRTPAFNIVGFVDDNDAILGNDIIFGLKVIGNVADLIAGKIAVSGICLAIANNAVRVVIYERLKDQNFDFPNIIDPSVYFDSSNTMGKGNIIGHFAMLTCNIHLGDFNILNGTAGFGHDITIGNFNLFGPRTTISGGVTIGDQNTINLQTSVLQNVRIGNRNTVNLHSCLFKSIKDDGVYFGVPAMRQKF